MEVVGAAASFIAIGQALASIPKLISIIQTVANTRKELAELSFELKVLTALSNDVQNCIDILLSESLPNGIRPTEPAYIQQSESELEGLLLDLKKLAADCETALRQDPFRKLGTKLKLAWQKSKIKDLCSRARRIFGYLEKAMIILAMRASIYEKNWHTKVLFEAHAIATQKYPVPSKATKEPKDLTLSGAFDPPNSTRRALQSNPLVSCGCYCHLASNRAMGMPSLLSSLILPRGPCFCNCAFRARGTGFSFDISYWLARRKVHFTISFATRGLEICLSVPIILERSNAWSIIETESEELASKWLIRNEISPRYLATDGWSVIEYAVHKHQWEIVLYWLNHHSRTLIDTPMLRQAALRAKFFQGTTRTLTARESYTCQRIIQLAGQEDEIPAIHQALHDGQDLQLAIALQPTTINEIDGAGEAPLHIACRMCDVSACTALIRAGADINRKDPDGDTPLHVAAWSGVRHLAQLLLDAGCDINSTNKQGLTPLVVAVAFKNPSMVSYLIRRGASIHSADNHHRTALHYLCMVEQTPSTVDGCFETLILAGATFYLEAKNIDGKTPLLLAVEFGNPAMVRLLLQKDVQKDVIDNYGNNILHIAALYGSHELFSVLLHAKITTLDIRTPNDHGWTPLKNLRHVIYTRDQKPLVKNPSDEGNSTFEYLLRDIRDQGINAECVELQQLISILRGGKKDDARAVLRELVKRKIRAKIGWEAETFRAIELDVRKGDLVLAIESIQIFMMASKARLELSPLHEEKHPYRDSESDGDYSDSDDEQTEDEDYYSVLSDDDDKCEGRKRGNANDINRHVCGA